MSKFQSFLYVGISVIALGLGSYFYTVNKTIIILLELLIILEIVRMISNFVLDKGHKVNLRYAVDGSIIYIFRELYIALTAFQLH